jgi:hypothetical protein
MIVTLLVVFLLLEVLDTITTIYGLKNGMTEGNFILRKFISKIGLYPTLALFKIPVMLGSVYAVFVEKAGLVFILLLVIPYTALGIYNLYQIYRYRKQ